MALKLFKEEWAPLLGMDTDINLSKRLGTTWAVIYFNRTRRGVPAFRKPKTRKTAKRNRNEARK